MKYLLRSQSGFKTLATTSFFLLMTFFSSGQDRLSGQEHYGKQAGEIVPGAVMVQERAGTQFPANVRLAADHFVPLVEFESYLRNHFQFSADYGFEPVKTQENATGLSLQAYQVTYQGIPIEHATVIAHHRNGMVERFNGFADHAQGVSHIAAVGADEARAAALASVNAPRYLWEVPAEEAFLKKQQDNERASHYPAGQLILVEGENEADGYRLAWQFDVRDAQHVLDRRIFVDAHSGEVIKWYSLVYYCDAGTVATTWHGNRNFNTDYDGGDEVFYLLDDCGGAEIHTILEDGNLEITNADNSWDESNVTDFATTHFYGRVTIDYFQAAHGRLSYDDSDGDLLMRHVASWANAQYVGSGTLRFGMNTGNQGDFYNTLDVVSHEFTHAVTDNNGLGGLTYQGESGALNESFSDILGETCELWFENGAYAIDWLHREDYVGGENRSFLAPKDQGQPDTYLGDNWASTCGGCPDAGGVHINSGVMNHWFYLVTVGGSGENDNEDEYSVNGLGHVATRDIAYRMLTEEMTSDADYADARTAAINIAIDIYGDCSYELKQVMNAWYAVGVGNPYCEAFLESPLKPGGFNISCNGGSDGEINLTPIGTAPFSFQWDDGPTTADRSGLTAGTYEVTLTDATGCTDVKSITLDEPPPLTIEAGDNQTVYYGYPPAECATLSYSGAGGGVPPYSFSWSTAESTQDIDVCPMVSTMYYITITDANGCTATDSVIVCAIDVRCGNKLDKVEICHFPPDNPANFQTLCVAVIAVAEHLSHGDMLAACGTDHSCTDLLPKESVASSPVEFSQKLQASPNPFSESTRISFATEMDGHASLRLVDSYGRVVETVFDQIVTGYTPYDVDISGKNYLPGLYYCSLVHPDGRTEVIKLILRD